MSLVKSSREKTHARIRLAIHRIKKGAPEIVQKGRKLSISSVAEEAGVSAALIHKDYPDLLAKIRGEVDKSVKSQRDEKNAALKIEREKNRQLRQQIDDLKAQRNALASENATLELENQRLAAISSSEKVTVMRGKGSQKP